MAYPGTGGGGGGEEVGGGTLLGWTGVLSIIIIPCFTIPFVYSISA